MATMNAIPADPTFSFSFLPRPTKTYHSQTYEGIALKNTGFQGKGKTIFITGGATGVGLATTKAFANAGVARIIIMSRSPGPLEATKSALATSHPNLQVEVHSASITDHTLVSSILRSSGHIDVLVHCAAAIHRMDVRPRDLPVEDIQLVSDTNTVGPFNLLATYAGLPSPKGRNKTFINISTAMTHLRLPLQIGYGASKAAFAQIVEHFAADEDSKAKQAGDGKRGMRVFNVHPGAFYTDLARKHMPEETMAWEDINLPADYCVWLAGPKSDYLHGRFLWPHWDVDELEEVKERIERDSTYLTISLVQ